MSGLSHVRSRRPMRLWSAIALLTVFTGAISLCWPTVAQGAPLERVKGGGDIMGQVVDSAHGAPLQSASVSFMRGTQVVFRTSTDAFGRFTAHNIGAGTYTVVARLVGFSAVTKSLTVNDNDNVSIDFRLPTLATVLEGQTIQASVPLTLDTRSGNQQFQQDQYHGAPTTTTSQIVQQSVMGAARAPTGEVHIRGQHAEYSYYIDGVPVPSGISGSLNELFDPSVVSQIDFLTGGWDAEYGNKNAAVIDVATRIPTGAFHANLSGYTGSFNTNGQAANVSGNSGKFGYFFSGARQVTDMREEPVVFDTTTYRPINFHNHGEDLFGFGKMQYTASTNDIVTLEGNWSRTRFQVPFDSTGGTMLNDNQQDLNTFVNLGWHHRFGDQASASPPTTGGAANVASAGSRAANELFAGLFYRYGTLRYTPGTQDDAQFVFYPDTLTPYNLSENRNFSTYGVKADYSYHPLHELEFKVGTLSSITRGHEDFSTFTQTGDAGPASNSTLSGSDVGVYAQTAYSPVEQFEIRAGLRYDAHTAPFAGTQTQLSPRIRFNFYPNPSNTLYLYYGRQFIPTNIEDLRSITSVAQAGVATVPTLPERDNFYEVGYLHRFLGGVVAKLDGYYKQSSPGVDDNTVPGSTIVTDVNIQRVKVTGIETGIEVRPAGPLSGYLNLAVNHAYGYGTITGGFFPGQPPSSYFDLDHDQRVSGVASVTYAFRQMYVSATGIYGSGLTNGITPDSVGDQGYCTGLFCSNSAFKVKPNFIGNLSAGYSFVFGRTVVRPELFIDNVFNKDYLLKGAFFSGAAVGRPRSVQFRMNVGV